jgi:hypothetical protein
LLALGFNRGVPLLLSETTAAPIKDLFEDLFDFALLYEHADILSPDFVFLLDVKISLRFLLFFKAFKDWRISFPFSFY